MNDTGSTIQYTVELHGDIHTQSSFREQVNEHGGEIVAERSVDDAESDDNDADIEITFGPDNNIQNIETADGVSVGELQLVLQGIENDPLWLQSPADRETDANTAVSVSLDQELPAP
jgi:hypothetical protein